ncbi:hypothetical protein CASFOL_020326 [Castilleja foliolosa]|uniref:Uncharacterized protein n=1 Tax=Castilleja foliolosa TaxID=1961234 RepID=A0ABD3D3A5_9LAMI
MKTQQKIQPLSPLRKSPRFSSPHPSIQNSARPKPKLTPKTRPDDVWALSLHVAEQVPLKICYPSDEEDKPIRRSSRFTASKYKTPSQGLTSRAHEDARSGDKQLRFSEDEEATARATKKTKLGSDESILLRRSYRLKGGKTGNSAPQILALPGPGSKSTEKSFLSEKSLRSRSVLMHKVEKVSTKVNSSIKCLLPPPVNHTLVKSPEVTVKASVKGDFDIKCLRSRSVKLSAENVKTKDLIELPEYPRRNSLGRFQKDSGESSKQASPEKSAFSREKRLKSRNVKRQLDKETLPEKSRSSLRRSRRNIGENSKIESKESVYTRSVKRHLQKEISEILPEKSRSSLRRSRMNSGENSKIESKKSSFSGGKCLSSRNVETELEKESSEKSGCVLNEKRLLSPKIVSVLDELFGVSEETDVEKSDSDVASEKCVSVRSRKIKRKINVDENADKVTGRIEGWCGSESEGDDVEKTVRSEKKESRFKKMRLRKSGSGDKNSSKKKFTSRKRKRVSLC